MEYKTIELDIEKQLEFLIELENKKITLRTVPLNRKKLKEITALSNDTTVEEFDKLYKILMIYTNSCMETVEDIPLFQIKEIVEKINEEFSRPFQNMKNLQT